MWNSDIKKIEEIREFVSRLAQGLISVQQSVERILGEQQEIRDLTAAIHAFPSLVQISTEIIKKEIQKTCESYYAGGTLGIMHDKMDILMENSDSANHIALATKTLDKFEDYMKNIDKLNAMINEFKGCVSMARAAFAERKKPTKASKRPSRG